MKNNKSIRLSSCLRFPLLLSSAFGHPISAFSFQHFRSSPIPAPPPEQLPLNLDQPTASGLPLREALPVRSAEYWLQLGEPAQALKELQTLPELARQHDWPQRVYLQATHAGNP